MVKPVSLSNDAYDVLSKMKAEGESFSDVVLRLAVGDRKKFSVDDFAGKWPVHGELDRISKELVRSRKNFRTRKVNF